MTAWRRGRAGFTIIELMAAIALLIILMVIMFTVFGVAGRAVSTYKGRLERYASIRGIFRLIEDDVTSAFLLRDYTGVGSTRMGFTGEDAVDAPFLSPAPDGDSDRLSLIRLRRGYDPSNPKPGVVDVCYMRVNSMPNFPDRPNALVRVMDQEEAGEPGSYESSASSWAVGDPLPLGFGGSPLFPIQSDGNYFTFLANHQDRLMDYLVALNVTDLQFEYCQFNGSWTGNGNWDCDTLGLPRAVRVVIRFGSVDSISPTDQQTYEDIIYLPAAH